MVKRWAKRPAAEVFQLEIRVFRDEKATRRARRTEELTRYVFTPQEWRHAMAKMTKSARTRAHRLAREQARKAGRKPTSKDYAVGTIIEKRHLAKQKRRRR